MQPTEANVILPHPCAVRSVVQETKDTFTLALAPPAGELARFLPGQFSMLWVFGVGEVPVSISGDPADSGSLTYTVRSVGPATQVLVSRQPGEALGVRGPYGSSWPVEAARGRDILVVAGGIGLAPLRPVIYHVQRNRDRYGKLMILYGARSPRDILFKKELALWEKAPDVRVLSTVDSSGVSWHGRVGFVTSLLKFVRVQPFETTAMICGPEIMMRFVARELVSKGLRPEDIHLSMERHMKCAVGFCGRCQWGRHFICKDGPVFSFARIGSLLDRYEL